MSQNPSQAHRKRTIALKLLKLALQEGFNTKVNNLTQTLQETQESSEAKIREKEEKIAEQAQTILDQQAEIEQLVKCSRSEIKQTRMQVKSENKSDIAVLLNRIRDLKTQLKDSGDLIKAKDKEIAKFQKLNERHTQIIFHKNSEISDLNRLKIELQNSLHEEQSKLTLESAKLRNTNEQVRKGEQEYSELQEEMRKYRSKNRLTIEENGDLKAENENLKFQLQSLKPKLDEEKDRCSLLENKYRDLLFGLEGCRQVIEEPKCLKQKVGGLKTQSYLAELKGVAKLSGKLYHEVLQDMMTQISKSIAELKPPADEVNESDLPTASGVQSPHKVPVVVKNESGQDICLLPSSVIAELEAYECTINDHHVSETSPKPLSFDFGDSPIPAEWKERVAAKLNAMPEVFAHHDLDFGCTSQVKHRINLSDNTPFKHRARPIHPQDVEAVRKHLKDLLMLG
ncbi:hypothetical protein WMY93_005537 [Mugilogobius chulae]|uniref:Uncharacterized protein n=1 Tax=Mugilogobius chulae TaxID=88201 RepID=A0AAW0PK11_9GOBI